MSDPGSWKQKLPRAVDTLAYIYAPIRPYLEKLELTREGPRRYNAEDVLLPQGYRAEIVATGFNAPVHCSFDQEGFCYVTEAGYKVQSRPRILKVDTKRGTSEVFFELPEDRWIKTGALTGSCWHEGILYFSNTDTVSRLGTKGLIDDVVTGLPGRGDHQTNYPVMGPDGKLYFGQGTATNSGVVGADNFAYEWLGAFKQFHDVPGADIALAGRNFEYKNVLGDLTETVESGAFSPFGIPTTPGQVVKGNVKCNGAILRCNPDGSDLELLAWGLRNPYGIAFHPDGRLFATEHGIDERGRRFIRGDFDDLYEIKQGSWYGWPDFASGIRLDDPIWGPAGQGREPVLQTFPDPNPPKPFVTFSPHAAANGLDFCRDPSFGFEGDAFVAMFGDFAPQTTRALSPVGYKVVRVDMKNRKVADFAVNRIVGPASKLPHRGFERPSHCCFGPDGALYVVDWGVLKIAPEIGGPRMKKGTGALWRIVRTSEPAGAEAPTPKKVPLHGASYLAGAVLPAAGIALVRLLRRRSKTRPK